MSRKPLIFILGVAALGCQFSAPRYVLAQVQPSTVIEQGKATATIYLDANAAEATKRASTELQLHLQEMTGVTVPITSDLKETKGYVIYLGDNDFARKKGIVTSKMKSDGYRILSNPNWLIIAGKDYVGPIMSGFANPWRLNETYSPQLKISIFGDAGTMFGVYNFLERYGVRWYMPGKLGTVVPKLNKIVVPKIDVSNAPFYEQRHAYYGFPERSDDQTLWYRRAGFGSPAPIAVNHSFGEFFGKYKDTHPEYFALIDGKRDFTNLGSAEMTGTFNLSDPGLLKQAINDAREFFDKNPEQKIYSLVPNDGYVRMSEDPASQAQLDKTRGFTGEFSNYVWGFIDKVAREVIKTHPDKLIGCIAYSKYQLPPSNIEKLSPNVAVVICKLRATYPDPAGKKRNMEAMANWAKKASTIYNWEYYCNPLFNPGWQGYPMFFTGIVQDELKALKGITKGEFIEAETWLEHNYHTAPDKIKINRPGLESPLLYVTARLLWNPDLDMKKTMDEYYKLFYGPAEKPMRSFWELVESNWNKKGWHTSPNQVYDSGTILKLLGYVKDAQKQAPEGSDYRGRVDLIYSEFSPAGEMAQRLEKIGPTTADVPRLALPQATPSEAPLLQMLDRSYQPASPVTNFRVTWDKTNIYVDADCYEPNMDKVKALATKRDSAVPPIWDDDSIEIFISPDAAQPYKCYQYIVNANGTLFDGKYAEKSMTQNQGWNGNAKVDFKKETNRWKFRLTIPWTDLDVNDAAAGRKMLANFYRNRLVSGQVEQYSWAPLKDGNYFSPENFGTLNLVTKQVGITQAELPASIVPVGIENFGSGAPLKGLYSPGGVPNVGIFVGNPNPSVRNDRALFRYNLQPLLEAAGRIEKVDLVFYPESLHGPVRNRTIEVQHFLRSTGTLNEDEVSSPDVEPAGTFEAKSDDMLGFTRHKNLPAVPVRLDVTELVLKDLAAGRISSTFRWRDVLGEKEGNPTLQATGVGLSYEAATIPTLHITYLD